MSARVGMARAARRCSTSWTFPELGGIITDRWSDFEDLLGDKDWVDGYFDQMNRSRRAIGHTGELNEHAVERMELAVKEWLLVVG
jgi:hypothetical protein